MNKLNIVTHKGKKEQIKLVRNIDISLLNIKNSPFIIKNNKKLSTWFNKKAQDAIYRNELSKAESYYTKSLNYDLDSDKSPFNLPGFEGMQFDYNKFLFQNFVGSTYRKDKKHKDSMPYFKRSARMLLIYKKSLLKSNNIEAINNINVKIANIYFLIGTNYYFLFDSLDKNYSDLDKEEFLKRSEIFLNKAVMYGYNKPSILKHLGKVCEYLSKINESIIYFEKLYNMGSKEFELIFNLGCLYMNTDTKKAKAYFREAKKYAEDSIEELLINENMYYICIIDTADKGKDKAIQGKYQSIGKII